MSGIYIALGANLANQKAAFVKALQALEAAGVHVTTVSGVWQSPSWPPGQGHPDYLNAVAEAGFDGTPEALLSIMQGVEYSLGRVRSERNAPRTLDLDIVDFKGRVMATPTLTLPHPRMRARGFVLFPLAQIAPDWRDPVSGKCLEYFIEKLPLPDVAPMEYRGRFWAG